MTLPLRLLVLTLGSILAVATILAVLLVLYGTYVKPCTNAGGSIPSPSVLELLASPSPLEASASAEATQSASPSVSPRGLRRATPSPTATPTEEPTPTPED